jgi:hypothetical protein
MSGHVDAEALALCREGLLGRREAARIKDHVSSCPRCAEVDAALGGLPALLALTSVPPMPPDLAARIDAALAAEATARTAATSPSPAAQAALRADAAGQAGTPGLATAPGQVGASGPGGRTDPRGPGGRTDRSRPAGRNPWRGLARPRKLLALSVATVIAAGGGFLISRMQSLSGSSPTSSAAAPATAGHPAAGAAQPNSAASVSLPVIASGTDYQAAHLAGQVAAVLGHHPFATQGAGGSAPADGASGSAALGKQPRAAAPAALAACVARISAGQLPRLVDEARYNGRVATIIVLPGSVGHPAQVWVVGPACSASRSDVIAHTLLPGAG